MSVPFAYFNPMPILLGALAVGIVLVLSLISCVALAIVSLSRQDEGRSFGRVFAAVAAGVFAGVLCAGVAAALLVMAKTGPLAFLAAVPGVVVTVWVTQQVLPRRASGTPTRT